jgi:hypothetical protein
MQVLAEVLLRSMFGKKGNIIRLVEYDCIAMTYFRYQA